MITEISRLKSRLQEYSPQWLSRSGRALRPTSSNRHGSNEYINKLHFILVASWEESYLPWTACLQHGAKPSQCSRWRRFFLSQTTTRGPIAFKLGGNINRSTANNNVKCHISSWFGCRDIALLRKRSKTIIWELEDEAHYIMIFPSHLFQGTWQAFLCTKKRIKASISLYGS